MATTSQPPMTTNWAVTGEGCVPGRVPARNHEAPRAIAAHHTPMAAEVTPTTHPGLALLTRPHLRTIKTPDLTANLGEL